MSSHSRIPRLVYSFGEDDLHRFRSWPLLYRVQNAFLSRGGFSNGRSETTLVYYKRRAYPTRWSIFGSTHPSVTSGIVAVTSLPKILLMYLTRLYCGWSRDWTTNVLDATMYSAWISTRYLRIFMNIITSQDASLNQWSKVNIIILKVSCPAY